MKTLTKAVLGGTVLLLHSGLARISHEAGRRGR